MSVQEAKKLAFIINAAAELIVSQAERIEALEALLSPPAILPLADVPVRQVTGIDVDGDAE